MKLSIDIETYSGADLPKSGVYKYAESEDFSVLLFGYSFNDGPVSVVDLASGEKLPDEVLHALTDPKVEKWAFNAAFERVCISRMLGLPAGTYLQPEQWRCSMIWAGVMGLPMSLAGVGSVLRLKDRKLDEGKGLIRLFSRPGTDGRRRMPWDAPEKWDLFKTYNARDVEVEMAVQHKLRRFPVPASTWEEWHLDQRINDRGVLLDMTLVRNALEMSARSREEGITRLKEITGVENPGSVAQMKGWLDDNGLETESLDKKAVAELMKTAPGKLKEALELRAMISKSSVMKYAAMENAVCSDGRARGMFQFCGASRTGRFSGKLIQLQNLPQNHIPDLSDARELVRSGDYDSVEMLFDSVPDTLSQLIRTAFVAPEGKRFIVADYSAIEARVIAWLAGEQWRMDLFRDGGDIYCMSASQMFHIPVVKHGVNGHLRQKGKIAELACGYQGGAGALRQMGALEMGIPEEELQPIVDAWRSANPAIVRFWADVDACVREAVEFREETRLRNIGFAFESGMLRITLPSGRKLTYVKPKMGKNRFGGESVTYEGQSAAKQWERLESYGGKFVENIVQATARDILCHAMLALRDRAIVMHVHDEVVIESGPELSLEEVCRIMGTPPPWAEGLLLRADGYETEFYRKD